MIATGVLSRQLIGRSREIAFLIERTRDVSSGRKVVVVRGEAGIGKTRLIGDFARLAQKEGKRVAIGTAREFANGPYGQFAEALLVLGLETLPPVLEPGGEGKIAWYAAVTEALRTAVASTPSGAVIILDDLHWADAATIDLLRFASTRLSDSRILFVTTYRNEDIESDTARARALSALERDADIISLQPLPPGQIEHLIAGVLENLGRRIEPNVVAEIRELSDGRPFFAEELLRGVLERLARDERAIPTVPSSVRATVRERYASLDTPAREVLLHAAVFGRHFSASTLSELLGVDLAVVYSSLRHARDLQLVIEDPGDDEGDRFAFRHALTREAVYAEMLRAEARIVHGRVAELLAARHSLNPAEIAEHTWRARNDDSGIWNERAGDAASSVYAYADAARLYERSFRSSRDHDQRSRVSEQAAKALYAIGDVESSATWYAHAAEANREQGNHSQASRLSLRRARILYEAGRYDEGLAEADRLATDDESVEPALRFEAEVVTAGLLVGKGRPHEALKRLQKAETIVATRDLAAATALSATYAYVMTLTGQPDEARHHFAETIRRAQASGNSDLMLRTYNNWGSLELNYGTAQRASELYVAALPIASQTKNLRQMAWLAQNAALAALLSGDLGAAESFLKQERAIDHGVAAVHRWSLALAVRLATLRGQSDEHLVTRALHVFESSRDASDVPPLHVLGSALAYHFGSLGASEQAVRLAAEASTDVELAVAPYWILDVAALYGDRDLRGQAHRAVEQIAALTQTWPARAFAALIYAREAQRARDRKRAAQLANEAAEAFAKAGWHLHEAFAFEIAGRVGEALASLRAMGALGEVRRLTETGPTSRRRGDSTLTAREREIARMVAAGRPAKGIAEALVISERTVESHIASVYRKLGVSNRSSLSELLEKTEQ